MDWKDIGLKTLEVLSPALLAAVTWAAAKGAQLITAKIKNETLRGILVRLDDAVLSAVREVQQVTVDAIKAASADGTLTPDEQAQVKQAAIASVKSYLGPKGIVEIAKVLGLDGIAVDALLATRVEAAVHDLKLAHASVESTDASAGAGTGGTVGVPLPLAPA